MSHSQQGEAINRSRQKNWIGLFTWDAARGISLLSVFLFTYAHLPMASATTSFSTEESSSHQNNFDQRETKNEYSVSATELGKGLAAGITKVDEFVFIRERAKSLGVKVYLFGGTAAAFAHYVKWDLLRQKGDERFQEDRFDYRYINIYRSTQDLDIVVDGSLIAISSLQNDLASAYPYLQGSKGAKSSWEVRSLRESHGTKIALLDNPDFLNQHTDSQSVGMVEITEGANPIEIVRDLRQWNDLGSSKFLQDVLEGKIHFYFSDKHESTKFFKDGRNPPIVAVIRYFIKLFQLELEPRPEDESILRSIIDQFEPKTIAQNSYLDSWFKNNVPKLLQNAMDVENANRTIKKFGLFEKLKAVSPEIKQGSISWWLDKQPLLTRKIGEPGETSQIAVSDQPPVTARSLGIDIVSHETTSFLVYEAITRSHKGLPNVFISRNGKIGESAAYGDGFYVMKGKNSGFRQTGFTIRFKMHPDAVAGVDFDLVTGLNYIVVHNRSVLMVIPENLQLDLIGYYSMLLNADQLSKDDLGVYHRLQFALRSHFLKPRIEELEYLRHLEQKELKQVFELDSTPDGKLLLLGVLVGRPLNPSQIVEVMTIIKGTEKQFSTEEMKKFNDKFIATYLSPLQDRFLNGNPSLGEIERAYDAGLFQGREVAFLEASIPLVQSVEDGLKVVRFWGRFVNLSATKDAKLRRLLVEFGNKFFGYYPNENDASTFVEFLNADSLALGLAAYHFEDPLVFGMSVMTVGSGLNQVAKRKDKEKRIENLKRFWKKQRARFLEEQHTLSNLSRLVSQIEVVEIQFDLAKYALDHKLFVRRNDLLDFVRAFSPLDEVEVSDPEGVANLKRQMTDRLLAFKGLSRIDLYSYLASGFPDLQSEAKVLAHPNFRLESLTDFFDLQRRGGKASVLNDLVVRHPEWFSKMELSVKGIKDILGALNYGDGSLVVIKKASDYFKETPQKIFEVLDPKLYLDLSEESKSRLNEIWARSFWKVARDARISNEDVIEILDSAFSIENYRAFLKGYVGRIKTAEDLSVFEWIWAKVRRENSNIVKLVAESELRKINEEIMQPHVYKILSASSKDPNAVVRYEDIDLIGRSFFSDASYFRILRWFLELDHASGGAKGTVTFLAGATSFVRPPGFGQTGVVSPKTREEVVKFILAHAKWFKGSFERFRPSAYLGVLNDLFAASDKNVQDMEAFRPHGNRTLLDALYRYFTLLGMRSIHHMVENPRLSRETLLNELFGFSPSKGFYEETVYKLFSPIGYQLLNQFRAYVVLDHQTEETTDDLVQLGFLRAHDQQIALEIDQAGAVIEQWLIEHPGIKKQFEEPEESMTSNQCRQAITIKK